MACDWVAVDWGTSNLRAWAMVADAPIAAVASNDGLNKLSAGQFEPTLLSLIDPWLSDRRTDVVACGMVGAQQGWVEAPYRAVPCAPTSDHFLTAPTTDPRIRVLIAPGLKQDRPADVMRGEETQIAGFLTTEPEFDGVLCLPGTHTKWVHISAGEVVSFRTFMTGEMFALLANQSVLRHSLDPASDEPLDENVFADALGDTMAKPEAIAARLFGLRAEALLHEQSPGTARARLSGFLVGLELAAARPYWLGRRVAVIGEKKLAAAYGLALTTQGISAHHLEGDKMSLLGLTAAYHGRSEQMGCAT